MATLALLQALTVAVNSDWRSGVSAKPDENRITVLRPGTDWRFLARVRTASNMLRAPKSAIGLRVGAPKEATVEGAPVVEDRAPREATCVVSAGSLGLTAEYFTPDTTCFSLSLLAVKFWAIRSVPPKSATAISRSLEAVLSINWAAACRARA